jgi:hypothetical protein
MPEEYEGMQDEEYMMMLDEMNMQQRGPARR